MPEPVFSLLCTLETFDLRGNPGINQKTLIGHLACALTNLKDQKSIDVSDKDLAGAARGLPRHTVRRSEMRSESRAGPLPKMWPVSLEILNLSGGEDDSRYGGTDKRHKFIGGIPAEWCSMTNLKELKMAYCVLDGESA